MRRIVDPVGVYEAQALHDAALAILATCPAARHARITQALVFVSVLGERTKAVTLRKDGRGAWELDQLFTADYYVPGSSGLVVRGLW